MKPDPDEQILLSGSLWWLVGCVLAAMALGALLALIACNWL